MGAVNGAAGRRSRQWGRSTLLLALVLTGCGGQATTVPDYGEVISVQGNTVTVAVVGCHSDYNPYDDPSSFEYRNRKLLAASRSPKPYHSSSCQHTLNLDQFTELNGAAVRPGDVVSQTCHEVNGDGDIPTTRSTVCTYRIKTRS